VRQQGYRSAFETFAGRQQPSQNAALHCVRYGQRPVDSADSRQLNHPVWCPTKVSSSPPKAAAHSAGAARVQRVQGGVRGGLGVLRGRVRNFEAHQKLLRIRRHPLGQQKGTIRFVAILT